MRLPHLKAIPWVHAWAPVGVFARGCKPRGWSTAQEYIYLAIVSRPTCITPTPAALFLSVEKADSESDSVAVHDWCHAKN